MPVHAFIDTNIRLHYVSLDQIDWRKVLAADAVVLHIAPVVTHELDQHKWGSNDRLRKRAERVLRADHALVDSNSTKIRDGVEVDFQRSEPSDETFTKYRLSPTSMDNRLIAAVLEFRDEDTGGDIVVVTADLGMKLKAHHQSLKAVGLPDDLRLPEDADDKDKEIRRLREEVDAFKTRAPRLKIAFAGSSTHSTIALPSFVDRYERKYKLMEEAREAYRFEEVPEDDPVRNDPYGLVGIASGSLANVELHFNAERNRKYNVALRGFFAKYDEYVDELLTVEERARRTVEINLLVANAGSGTADDVDVFVDVKGVAGVFTRKTRPPKPKAPRAPTVRSFELGSLDVDAIFSGRTAVDELRDLREAMKPEIAEPEVTQQGGLWQVRFRVARVKQALEVRVPAVLIELIDDRDGGVQLDYRINTASAREDVNGTLHLIVKSAR